MRATISFELELDKVESTMATLVSQEADTLRIVTNILDNVGEGLLLPEVSEAIDLLQEVTNQLQQYQQMLVGFEKAKFETILPTSDPAPVAVQPSPVQRLGFDKFMDRLATEENDDAPQIEEG